MIWTYYTFQKVHVVKGTVQGPEFVVRLVGGVLAGVGADLPNIPMPKFVPGEEVVLFLGNPNVDGYRPINTSEVYRVRTDPASGEAIIVPAPIGLNIKRARDGGAYDHTPARTKLEDFLYTIERRFSQSSNIVADSSLPPDEKHGVEDAVETFSRLSIESGGIFAVLPDVNTSDPNARLLYQYTLTNLTLSAVRPTVGLVTPNVVPTNTSLLMEVSGGRLTNFIQDRSVLSFSGDCIVVNGLTVVSSTRLIADVSVSPTAFLGFRDVVVTTDLGGGTIEDAVGKQALLLVDAPLAPTIVSVSPNRAAQGETLDVTISGSGTSFTQDSSVADFGPDVTVNQTTVFSPTVAIANIAIDSAAKIAFRDVVVVTGSEIAAESVTGPFLVIAPPTVRPRIASISPSQGAPGKVLSISIEGTNTNFVEGLSEVGIEGHDVLVISTVVTSPTSATATIEIDLDATPGYRDVRIATGAEIATILDSLFIGAALD